MAIVAINGGFAITRVSLAVDEIEELIVSRDKRYPGTKGVEEQARELVQSGFKPADSYKFVVAVCIWARGHRLLHLIEKNNIDDIAAALSKGYSTAQDGKIPDAVVRISKLRGLGLSFASKQLRFLLPDKAVIFDKVIRTRIGYPESVGGYAEFLGDCQKLLSKFQRAKPDWRICDIEAAIFAKLQNRWETDTGGDPRRRAARN